MTWYELFLFVHILMAIVWVGGGVMLQLLALRVLPANDAARTAGFAGDVEQIGTKVFAPAAVLLLASAIGLMLNDASPWDWGDPFVSVGLVVWAISFVAGIAYLGPTSGKIARSIEATGPDLARVAAADRERAAVLADRARAAARRRVHDDRQARDVSVVASGSPGPGGGVPAR